MKLRYKLLILLFALAPILFTLPLDVIDIDTAQYAEIAREMVVNGDYLHLRDNGKKYLDKPILTFWTIALFYKIFGISEISFRLSAVFVLLLTAFILYKLSVLIYENETIGFYAAIIYFSLPGIFSIVLNPLIDTYLCLYLALIHYSYYLGVKRNSNWYYLMYWLIGMGFITKGPIALVIPAISIGVDILLRRDWNRLRDLRIWFGIPIAFFLPLVWSYLLVEEYSWYGPYFFLWQQSFGRFYDKIYNQAFNPPYFYMTFLWGIFPLSGFLLYIVYKYLESFFHRKEKFFEKINIFIKEARHKDFTIPLWIFLFLFLISFSRYQLPQYTYWTLPGVSIFLAYTWNKYLPKKDSLKRNLLIYFPSYISVGLLLIIPLLVIDTDWRYWSIVAGSLAFCYWVFVQTKELLLINLFPMQIVFLVVSLFVYPELLKYQPSKEIGKLIQQLEPNKEYFYSFGIPFSKRSYEFYSNRYMRNFYDKSQLDGELKQGEFRLVVTPMEYFNFLIDKVKEGYSYEIIQEKYAYKIATPTQKFLKKKTREKACSKIYLVKLTKK